MQTQAPCCEAKGTLSIGHTLSDIIGQTSGGRLLDVAWLYLPTTKPTRFPARALYPMTLQTDLAFDLGLHHGQDTAYYLAKGYRVVAFEAEPTLVDAACSKFETEIESGQLHIVSGAVAPPSYGDRVSLYVNQWSYFNSIEERIASKYGSDREVVVDRVDLAEALGQYGVPYFIKIDIEGVDRYVLDVLRLQNEKPVHLSMETEGDDFSLLLEDIETLQQLGYSRFRAVQQAWTHLHRGPVRTLDGRDIPFEFIYGGSGPFGEDLSQPWVTAEELIRIYRRVYWEYRLLGERGLLRKVPFRGRLQSVLARLLGRPVAGWHDTHATRAVTTPQEHAP